MLLIFGGLPATGKSTISKRVAHELGAAYIRIDTIEQALKDTGFNNVHSEGYEIAYKIAADNLTLGLSVVADSVNPLEITRNAWRTVGENARTSVFEIEIVCSDREEHQRRVRSRMVDYEQSNPVTWEDVLARHYEHWPQAHATVDTAGVTPELSVKEVLALISLKSIG